MCARCIMDTTDPEIEFDGSGICNHCHRYLSVVASDTLQGAEGRAALERIVGRIRAHGKGKKYDCIIGLSGGVDSSYVAYLTRELGLRPLAVHLDNGWNSEIAVRNIENVVNRLGIDLQTTVLDWNEFRSLQVAFLRASTPDCEIPTDHAITAVLYRAAIAHRVPYIVNGHNLATEQMMPRSWSYGHFDWRYVQAVARRHGDRPLRTFPHYTAFEHEVRFPFWDRLRDVSPLNLIDYNKTEAAAVIKRELGWQHYGAKHHESIYTRFYQTYILPRKFGVDKRRAHLSCLINGGQLTRDQALSEIAIPSLDDLQVEIDKRFVLKKLSLTADEFAAIEAAPIRSFWDYDSYAARRPFWWDGLVWRGARLLGDEPAVHAVPGRSPQVAAELGKP
jgi:N-acetyl sugar amidotransferase